MTKQKDAPEEMFIDPMSMTTDEMGMVEEALNCDFQRAASALSSEEPFISDAGKRVRSSMVMRAFIWVTARRDNPELTLEEAGKIPFGSLQQTS